MRMFDAIFFYTLHCSAVLIYGVGILQEAETSLSRKKTSLTAIKSLACSLAAVSIFNQQAALGASGLDGIVSARGAFDLGRVQRVLGNFAAAGHQKTGGGIRAFLLVGPSCLERKPFVVGSGGHRHLLLGGLLPFDSAPVFLHQQDGRSQEHGHL